MKLRIALVGLLLVGCTDEPRSRHALEASGFTDIHFDGSPWFACGEGDYFSTSFTAKNPRGQSVKGVVCCGALKDCTVRF